jgi:hypothetical protein
MGCEPGDPPKVCLPPYRNLDGGGFGEGTNGGTVTPEGPDSSPGAPGSGANPPAAPSPASGNGEEQASDDNASESRGGCSLAVLPGTATSGAGLTLFAALMAFTLRRSRSRRPAALRD